MFMQETIFCFESELQECMFAFFNLFFIINKELKKGGSSQYYY